MRLFLSLLASAPLLLACRRDASVVKLEPPAATTNAPVPSSTPAAVASHAPYVPLLKIPAQSQLELTQGALEYQAIMHEMAGDAGFAEVFGCAHDDDCFTFCEGAMNAKFGARASHCFDGCQWGGTKAICTHGVCAGLRGDGCSPGLYADAGPVDASLLSGERREPPPPRDPSLCKHVPQRVCPIDRYPGRAIAVAGGFVYWTDVNRLQRAPVAGGASTALLSTQFVHSPVAAGADLFFTARMGQTPGSLFDWEGTTGSPRVVAAVEAFEVHPRLVEDRLYWSDARGLVRVNRHGGEPEIVERGASTIFAVDGNAHWWITDGDERSRVIKQRVGAGPALTLAPATSRPIMIACGGAACWVDGYWQDPTSGRLVRNRAGTNDVEIVAPVNQLEALAFDGDTLFWAEDWSGRSGLMGTLIRSSRLDGSSQTDLAFDPGHTANAMTVANGYVYWIAFGLDGAHYVSRVPSR